MCTSAKVIRVNTVRQKPSMTQKVMNIYELHDEILKGKSDLNDTC